MTSVKNEIDSFHVLTSASQTTAFYSGDFVSRLLDTFERLIRNRVEREVEDVVCDELGSLGTTLVSDMLNLAEDTFLPYFEDLSRKTTDPLFPENNLRVPANLKLLDFQDTESVIGNWFSQALDKGDALLGSVVLDTDGPNSNGRDLGINVFLRSNILDEDRAFTLDLDDLPFETDGILFQGHDRLTETIITLDRVRVFGLDTFTRFDPLNAIGRYTLQNELSWEFLTVEMDAAVNMRPSTLRDTIIEEPDDIRVTEKIKIEFGVDQVSETMSIRNWFSSHTHYRLPFSFLYRWMRLCRYCLQLIKRGLVTWRLGLCFSLARSCLVFSLSCSKLKSRG
jgi:hypothetical protein